MRKPETRALKKRMEFVAAVEVGGESKAALCRRFGFSRKTGDKWVKRYRLEGLEGLYDRSRAPHEHPQAVTPAVAERCLAIRCANPTWGPVKVRETLRRQDPSIRLPAASTIGALLDRAGVTVKRKMRRRCAPSSAPFGSCARPNDVWCMDFKGWFLTGDGTHCEPLTLSDADSRYLLRCQVLNRNDTKHVWAVLDAAFREYGLPLRLRSDNGPPFASTGVGGLSRLAVKVIKAGVRPERIMPGKPQQNGRLERLHLTLLQDTASPPARTLREQLDRFRRFQRIYNEERPHAALAHGTPAEHYELSLRRWDGVLREPVYPADYAVRRVRPNGAIKWHDAEIYLGQTLAGEPIGLMEREDGSHLLLFGSVELGTIDPRGTRLSKPKPRSGGLVDNPGGFSTIPPLNSQNSTVNDSRKL